MKRIIVCFFCGVLALQLSAGEPEKRDADVFAAADWNWQPLGKGAEYGSAQLNLFESTQFISVIRYKARRYKTDIVDAPAEFADSTEALALRHNAIGAINGSYFNMKTLYPTTLVQDNGVRRGETSGSEVFRVDGVMAVRCHKVKIIRCDTTQYAAITRRHKEAMAAGPVLLLDGREARDEWPGSGFYAKRHPRTLIGTTSDGWVYLIVIDGRFPGQGIGTTIHETAMIAKMFGLKDALNLDGGGSSTLWTKPAGVVSHPYDNRRFDHYGQRSVPNIVVVR